MSILTLPTIQAVEFKWSLLTNTQTFTSPLSNATQTAEMAGARWSASLSFRDLHPAEHRVWLARQARLRGSSGRCYLSPSFGYPLLGVGGGTPLVKGFGQTGNSLNVDGCPLSTTGWLAEGDFFHFDNGLGQRELKIVTAAVNTNGAGEATITFEPPIRSAPADNAALEINAPAAVMRLVDDSQAAWTITGRRFGAGSAQFIESFPS